MIVLDIEIELRALLVTSMSRKQENGEKRENGLDKRKQENKKNSRNEEAREDQ